MNKPVRLVLDDPYYSDGVAAPELNALRVVLTRFTMNLPGFRQYGSLHSREQMGEWISRRVEIFKALCLKSVEQQTVRPDVWFIGLDATLEDLAQPILDAIEPFEWIRPAWQQAPDGVSENADGVFVREIQNLLQPHHDWVITTRLDCDDGLNVRFGEAVISYCAQVAARPDASNDFWLSFALGAQYNGRDCRIYPHSNNAFLTRCEAVGLYKSPAGRTAIAGNHSHVFRRAKTYLAATSEPMWLQWAHGGNLINFSQKALIAVRHTERELNRFGMRVGDSLASAANTELVDSQAEPIEDLDSLGARYGTDKSSENHNYLEIYDRHLRSMRTSTRKVLELGVFRGASLKMWRDYFPNAVVLGLDMKPECASHAGDRIEVKLGNCGSAAFLDEVAVADGPFDLIVDDASHQWLHQQIAFDALFKSLRPGGVYIIEDIHTSYHAKYGKGTRETTVDWLKKRLDIIVADRLEHIGENVELPGLPDWRTQVEDITFLRKSVLIRKRREEVSL